MTPDDIRQHLEPKLARQTPHPVHPLVEVLWDVPYDITQITIRVGGIIEQVAPEMVTKRVMGRQAMIERERTDPLRALCEPDIWRLIDLQMCIKRLEHPGMVLELLVTGGIRPGKTEGCVRRVNAHYFYTQQAWVWGLHETDTTSRTIQQRRVYRFLPPELDTSSGKHKKDKRTKFAYSEGTGFTGSAFNIYWDARDEHGVTHECGGMYEFRFYKQDTSTLQGAELTCAMSDELVPITVVKTVNERLSTRAADTAKPEFLARIRDAKQRLERGEALPLALLGAIYHSVHLISFTPKEGWNSTVSSFLDGARKYAHVEAELLKGVGGVQDARVPRFAQPVETTRLVAYLHTKDNVMKPAYPAVAKMLEGKSEREIRITAYGDVDKNWKTSFSYKPERHIIPWEQIGKAGTIHEVSDPAPGKPWVIKWYLVDKLGRKRVVQEWPCPKWEIPGVGFPGMWAVPSEHDKINGDPGPAQLLRLHWDWSTYTRLIWLGRKRLAETLRQHDPKGEGFRLARKLLTWKEKPEWDLDGEFVLPLRSFMDKHFATAPTVNRGKEMTILEAMHMEENKISFVEASAGSVASGVQFVNSALCKDIFGQPELGCVPECENTQFGWATFTLPEFRDDTRSTDEASKDFPDADRYYLASNPRYVEQPRLDWSGSQSAAGYGS